MKTRLFILLLFALVCPNLFGQNADDANIKKVIGEETNAFYNHDADAWQATWLHTGDVSHTFISNGFYRTQKGWENFGPQVIASLKANPKQMTEISSDSFLIKSDGKMAWVDFKQTIKTPTPQIGLSGTTRECRVLLKENGKWKLFSSITQDAESFDPSNPQNIENSMNTAGYELMNAKRLNDAIEVFKLNVKLFPDSWNTYDSLGEALALSGDKDGAIADYEKSVSLNPKNDNGIKALKKLREK
ncbi:MAG: tetratricopeptide repeat protein [Ginsengibacter sp.]